MMSCEGYRLSRRTFLGASAATFMGMQVRDLMAYAGKDHAAKAEHVISAMRGAMIRGKKAMVRRYREER